MKSSVVSVVIPAFNEEGAIGNTITETISVMNKLEVPYEIIVVDDGSLDNTRHIAAGYKVNLLFNEQNKGKGYALRKGFQHAQGDIVITIDADGSHKPNEIVDLLSLLFNDVDIVAGSRFLKHGRDSTKKLNQIGNFLFNLAIMIITKKRITDSQTGFRGFKKEFLQEIKLESRGYEIESEMTVKALKNGFVFQEIPISCSKREYNASKLRILSDGMRILKAILKANFINH